MKIEEAIVYVLAERNGGLKTEQIAEIINHRQLHDHFYSYTRIGKVRDITDLKKALGAGNIKASFE